MVTIVLAIAFGLLFTIIATENSQLATLNLFGTVTTFPLYVFLAITLLLGTLVATCFSIFEWTIAAFDTRKKESNYNNLLKQNDSFKSDIAKLRDENLSLKQQLKDLNSEVRVSKSQKQKEKIKNFFDKLARPMRRPQHQLS